MLDREVWCDALEKLGTDKVLALVSTTGPEKLQSVLELELGAHAAAKMLEAAQVKQRYISALLSADSAELAPEIVSARHKLIPVIEAAEPAPSNLLTEEPFNAPDPEIHLREP